MRQKGFTPLIILLFLVVVALMSLAYFVGQKSISKNYNTYSPTPTLTNLEQNSDWTTYLRYSDTYTFKYPSNFDEQGIVSGPISGNPVFIRTFSDPDTIVEGTDTPFDGFSLYKVNIGNLDMKSYIDQEKQYFNEAPTTREGGVVESQVEVGKQQVYTLKVRDNIDLYYIPLPVSKDLIVFSRVYANQSFVKIFDEILSTFKFTPIE